MAGDTCEDVGHNAGFHDMLSDGSGAYFVCNRCGKTGFVSTEDMDWDQEDDS